MSEQDTRNSAAPEQAENAAAQDAAAEKKAKKKPRRKRRTIGVPVTLTLAILVVALLFGLVVGYAYGRNHGRDTIENLRKQVAELSDQLVVASGEEIDIFKDTLTPAEEAALGELSGEAMTEPETNAVSALSSDAFGEVNDSASAADPVVVAEFKGGKITADAARDEYARRMSGYLFAGFNEAGDGSSLMNDVLSDLVKEKVLRAKAEKLGLTDVTDQDAEALHKQAEEEFERRIAVTTAFSAAGDAADEEKRAAAEKYLLENEGTTVESIEAELKEKLWEQKLYDEIVKDVAVTDEHMQKLYDEMVETQKQLFTDSADSYEFAQMSGDTIAYNLPGYRRIQVIRLNVNNDENVMKIYDLNDQLTGLDPEKDAERIAQINAQIDECYATAEARGKSVAEKLKGGADFDDMIDQYGEDAGMKDPEMRKRGYVIAANSPLWAPDVRNAAMALEKTGDISEPVRTGDGVCIVKYIGDVKEGAVPMSEIKNALSEQALAAEKTDTYNAQVSQWIGEADPAYYPERMQ